MRITSADIRKIEEKFGEFSFCRDWNGNLYIRFGYWNKVNVDELQSILPKPMVAVEDTMEGDDFGDFGTLYSYEIRYF